MSEFTARFRSALWWLLPLAALAVLIGWETRWGGAVRKPLPAEEPIAAKPVEIALLPEYAIAGGVAARSETTSRTLFNPTRRPAPTALDAANARLQRGQFALTGTSLVDGRSTAILRETAGGKSRRVQQGESINGLLVAEVKPDRVRLALGEESEELVLKVATNPRPTPPPAAPAAPGVGPVAGAPPTPAAPPAAATATPAAAPAPPGAPQSLAERRRAARAAEAAAAGATMPQAGGQAAQPPATPAAAPAAPTVAPANADPRWNEVYQRYQQRNR